MDKLTKITYLTICANTSLATKGALDHRLHCHTVRKIQNGHQEGPKRQMGFEKGVLGAANNFCGINFLLDQPIHEKH